MRVVAPSTPAAFLSLALPLLVEDEAANCLPIGLATSLRDEPGLYDEARFWVVVDEDETPIAAALRTPPHNLVLARERVEGAIEHLAGAVDEASGVVGPQPELDRFVAARTTRTGETARVVLAEAIHVLETLVPAPAVNGALDEVAEPDEELVVEWLVAFAAEAAGDDDPARDERRAWLEHRLASSTGGVVLWRLSDGRPVSFAGYGGATPNGIRIGPVYTPPADRGNGYASALVSALTERLLREHRFCFLFTDLANPTSNRIYARLGYRQVCRADEIELTAGRT